MQAPPDLAQAHLSHLENTLERLNQRIARLAHWLDVPLDSEAQRLGIMDGSVTLPVDWHHTNAALDQRRRHEWQELRGLMVLRARLMRQTLDELGLETTYQMARLVREHMTIEGFQPGSDGFEMLQRLQAEHDRRDRSDR